MSNLDYITDKQCTPTLNEYGYGRDLFTSGVKLSSAWSKRKQEGWNAALRDELLFLKQLGSAGKQFEGCIRRLEAAGVSLAVAA